MGTGCHKYTHKKKEEKQSQEGEEEGEEDEEAEEEGMLTDKGDLLGIEDDALVFDRECM